MEKKSKIEYIWHRIKMGQTLNSIAKRNGIEDWKVLYEHNRDLLRNPNILNYIDEDIYDIGWCINNKQGIVRIPILNSQDQEEKNNLVCTVGTPILESTTTCSQDTPEQKEEWGKKVSVLIKEGLFEEATDDKGERVFGYVECSDKVLKEIRQLLSEREREAQIEVLTEIFQTCYQEDSKTLELVEEKLSKLTTK